MLCETWPTFLLIGCPSWTEDLCANSQSCVPGINNSPAYWHHANPRKDKTLERVKSNQKPDLFAPHLSFTCEVCMHASMHSFIFLTAYSSSTGERTRAYRSWMAATGLCRRTMVSDMVKVNDDSSPIKATFSQFPHWCVKFMLSLCWELW